MRHRGWQVFANGGFASWDVLDQRVKLNFKHWSQDGIPSYVSQATLSELREGEDPGDRVEMVLENDDAQHLMDDLWRCGLRPTEGKGSAGQLDAVKYHLEDMRSLVFKKEPK